MLGFAAQVADAEAGQGLSMASTSCTLSRDRRSRIAGFASELDL